MKYEIDWTVAVFWGSLILIDLLVWAFAIHYVMGVIAGGEC